MTLTEQQKQKLSNFIQSFGGLLLAVVFQVTSFVLLTRTLGVSAFGIFVSAVAIGLAISELVGLGCGENYIRLVSRDEKQLRPLFKTCLKAIGLTAAVFALPLAPIAAYFLAPEGMFWPVVLLIANEAIIVRTTLYFEHVALALKDFRLAALGRVIVPFLRCAGFLIVIFALGQNSLPEMIQSQLTATLVAAALMFMILRKVIINRVPSTDTTATDMGWMKFGLPTALSNLQRGVQTHADKYIVTLMAGPEVGGIYAAGFRFVQMALLPIQAYTRTTYSGFFEAGKEGLQASLTYARKVGRILVAIALFCGISAFIGAYFIPFILGDEYEQAADVVQALSPLLLLWSLQYLLVDTLRGADLAWPVNWISLTMNVVSLVLLVVLTLQYGLKGVIAASLLGLGFSVLLLAVAIFIFRNREKRKAVGA